MSVPGNEVSERSPPNGQGKVGYSKPPMRRRFKDSGNPAGRGKGTKNRKMIVRDVAKEMHSVRENGKRRRRSTLELVLMTLRKMALEEANISANDELQRLIKAYQPQAANEKGGYLVVPAPKTVEEFIAEAEKSNALADARRAAQTQGQI